MKLSNRLSKVPKYIFSQLDDLKNDLKSKNIEIIDLGIGDPDIPTPNFILDNLGKFIYNPSYHKYPPYSGIDELKKAISEFYKSNFNVELDYKTEIAVLIGSKEGIAHLFLALTDPNDYVIVPDPGYPVYYAASVISSCIPYKIAISERNNYLPDICSIYPEVIKKAKLFMVNYPNNPTGAVANINFFQNLVNFGIKNNIVIANDAAYMNICSSEYKPISIMQAKNSKKICVEFGSLSKIFNMTGFRIGYVVGCAEVIEKLMIVKTNFDSGQFTAIQAASAIALKSGQKFTSQINQEYDYRRNLVVKTLTNKNLEVYDSKGTFYVWFKVPKNYKSEEFTEYILRNTGVIITPGNFFGSLGEGYCRLSLTVNTKSLIIALERISNLNF